MSKKSDRNNRGLDLYKRATKRVRLLRETDRDRQTECVCVCMRERERVCVCVCERERERECVREREGERECVRLGSCPELTTVRTCLSVVIFS